MDHLRRADVCTLAQIREERYLVTSILDFWYQMTANPLLFMAVTLTLGVILVNGWTDAPNAIATCVVTRCMPPRAAILMAAVFNFLGVFVMTLLNATVAETITKMVDFGSDPNQAIIALSAALFAIVLWATLAWVFGIPTSESHALTEDTGDVLTIISWREIFECLEACADACENVSECVGSVVMKNT